MNGTTPLTYQLDLLFFIIFSIRYATLLFLNLLSLIYNPPFTLSTTTSSSSSSEIESGMADTLAHVVRIAEATRQRQQQRNQSAGGAQQRRSGSAFRDGMANVKKLLPFLWPRTLYLQSLVVACFGLLVVGRVVNVLVPLQYKVVVDALTPGGTNEAGDKTPYYAWGAILIFVSLRFLQGGVGLLSSLQYFLWIPVGQFTTREVSVKMLEHLHNLSLQFHLNRKTGEVLRIVFTIWITEWRTQFRRDMIDLDNASRSRAVDSLLNFETVKYYNAETYEVRAYDTAIRRYQAADWKSSASLNVLNTAQNGVITVGLLVGCLVCARRVVEGALSVGDFVLFLTYITQLYQPLNWFGTYYRVIQQNFIDMEKMLDLLKEGQSVKDAPNASELVIREGGKIVFDNVHFAYDARQPALKGVSFEVPVGKTVAVVGPSGGGKSTLFRLLFRFYDVGSGAIRIDGQDIRSVTQRSLRRHIGVVPQDTVLFNDTIRYNIRYGDIEASDAMVEEAASAAQIHERIVQFPD
ncbi:Homocysteine S-methyltransferase 1, partial [Quaeritorhiza haematococci]